MSPNAAAVLGTRAGFDPLQVASYGLGGPTSTSTALFAASPARSRAATAGAGKSVAVAHANPAALQRRMHHGPRAETRAVQKIIIVGVFLGLFAMMALSAFDHRFGWSPVPAAVCVIGDVLGVAGLCIGMLVVTQNSYAAATVRVEAEQKLASRGLYKFVRHPMYAGSLILMLGIPLALGSYWALLLIIPGLLVLVFRILDEEKLLSQELAGYRDYKQRVHFRLVPYV